jgi:hypothetical protein
MGKTYSHSAVGVEVSTVGARLGTMDGNTVIVTISDGEGVGVEVGSREVEVAQKQVLGVLDGEGSGAEMTCGDEQPIKHNKVRRRNGFIGKKGQFF